jgi:hypothetical protein
LLASITVSNTHGVVQESELSARVRDLEAQLSGSQLREKQLGSSLDAAQTALRRKETDLARVEASLGVVSLASCRRRFGLVLLLLLLLLSLLAVVVVVMVVVVVVCTVSSSLCPILDRMPPASAVVCLARQINERLQTVDRETKSVSGEKASLESRSRGHRV